MKNEFCKIFIVEDCQLLITKQYNSGDDVYQVSQITEIKGVRPTVSFVFKTKKQMNDCYKKYDRKQAEEFIEKVKDAFMGNES